MSINLFTTSFQSKSRARDHELLTCVEMNRRVVRIDRIYLLEEPPHRLRGDERLHIIRVDKRPTFSDIFAAMQSVGIGPDDFNIITNSDIFFDERGIDRAIRTMKRDECYALARW